MSELNTLKTTTVGVAEDAFFELEGIRVMVREKRFAKITPKKTYSRRLGGDKTIAHLIRRIHKIFGNLEFSILDANGQIFHHPKKRLSLLRETYRRAAEPLAS